MTRYSAAEIAGYAKGAGFTGKDLVIATAVAMAESAGDPDVVNSIGCVGLWQIFQKKHAPDHPTWSVVWLKHPGNNAAAAKLLHGQRRWKPWEAYTNGSYKTYLSVASKGVDQVLGVRTKSASASSGNKGASPGTVLAKAASYIGYVEAGNNITQFWARVAPKLQGKPWCGAFVYDVLKQSGLDLKKYGFTNPFYCPQIKRDAQAKGMWAKTARPGDLVILSWSRGVAAHVEFVEKVLPGGKYVTIGGNTSSGGRGSQNNGGGCWRRTRFTRNILGFVRLPYDMTKGSAGSTAGAGSGTMPANGHERTSTGNLKENGEWNASTAMDLRLASRMPVSVILTRDYWRHIEVWSGLTGRWVDADLDYVTIEALQWKTKQPITGRMDRNTILNIQKYLNSLRKDGILNDGIAPGPVPDGD